MNLAVLETLETRAKVQSLCTLVLGKAFQRFDLLSDDMESTVPLTVEYIYKGLTLYFTPVNAILKKSVMHRETRKPHGKNIR